MKYLFFGSLFLLSIAGCSSSGSTGDGDGDGDGSGGVVHSGDGGSSTASGGMTSGGSSAGGAGGAVQGTGGGSSLDQCFEDVPPAEGSFQDATKANQDLTYQLRLALDTKGSFGTSGTLPWTAVRLGLITPNGSLCLDEEALTGALETTHHNCDDVLTIVDGSTKYVIENPDSAIDYVDPEAFRRPSNLLIYENDVQVGGPIRLDTISCNEASDDGQCRSGGPC